MTLLKHVRRLQSSDLCFFMTFFLTVRNLIKVDNTLDINEFLNWIILKKELPLAVVKGNHGKYLNPKTCLYKKEQCKTLLKPFLGVRINLVLRFCNREGLRSRAFVPSIKLRESDVDECVYFIEWVNNISSFI